MKQLKNLTTGQILNRYELPHRFLVYFASQCAKDALWVIKNPDPHSVAAVDMAERYGNGEEIPVEERKRITTAAATYAAYYSAAHSAAYCAHAAAYSTYCAAAYSAAEHAHAATNKDYKELLITLINERLSEVEKLLIFS